MAVSAPKGADETAGGLPPGETATPVTFRDVTELRPGDVRASGGGITHIRFSRSGKTAWITDSTGLVERISASARIAVTGDTGNQRESTGELTYDEARQKMTALVTARPTDMLCTALLLLEGRDLDDAGRVVQGHITDELCRRFPEADAASMRWIEDPVMWELSLADVIIAAVTAAG